MKLSRGDGFELLVEEVEVLLWNVEDVILLLESTFVPIVDFVKDVQCVSMEDLFCSPWGVDDESLLAVAVS